MGGEDISAASSTPKDPLRQKGSPGWFWENTARHYHVTNNFIANSMPSFEFNVFNDLGELSSSQSGNCLIPVQSQCPESDQFQIKRFRENIRYNDHLW